MLGLSHDPDGDIDKVLRTSSEPGNARTLASPMMIRGCVVSASEVIEILLPFVSEERFARIQRVVSTRTRSVVAIVEGAANRGNVSAVMRTAEGLGFFDFHLVTSGEFYKQSRRSSQGAEKWIDVTEWEDTRVCLDRMSECGYQIVATSPDVESVPLGEIDFTRKTAVIFGNELEGISQCAQERSDFVARIALNGFVESYNISVAAAMCLYHVFQDRVRRQGFSGDLTNAEREELTATYCLRSVQRSEAIIAEHVRRAGLTATNVSEREAASSSKPRSG